MAEGGSSSPTYAIFLSSHRLEGLIGVFASKLVLPAIVFKLSIYDYTNKNKTRKTNEHYFAFQKARLFLYYRNRMLQCTIIV